MATLYTIGHSTRSLEDFQAALAAHAIETLVDVRRFPGSRRYPHFGADALAVTLPKIGIRYVHEPDLGGRRKAEPDSPNTYWRSEAFRAYADYMSSDVFQAALERLLTIAESQRVAIMCAEAVPWRCHRQLIADAAVLRGHEVVDIFDAAKAEPHRLNPQARLDEHGHVIYPAAESEQKELFK